MTSNLPLSTPPPLTSSPGPPLSPQHTMFLLQGLGRCWPFPQGPHASSISIVRFSQLFGMARPSLATCLNLQPSRNTPSSSPAFSLPYHSSPSHVPAFSSFMSFIVSPPLGHRLVLSVLFTAVSQRLEQRLTLVDLG